MIHIEKKCGTCRFFVNKSVTGELGECLVGESVYCRGTWAGCSRYKPKTNLLLKEQQYTSPGTGYKTNIDYAANLKGEEGE
jgi:hypothetical protein